MNLLNQLLAPPGGWKYLQIETGMWMTAITEETLLRKVSIHRRNNNIPQGNLQAEVEEQICQRLSPQSQIRLCGDAKPLPWPLYLQPFKLLAVEGDQGLGDIIARTVGPVGGDAFKDWYKRTMGQDCGCRDRQIYLNTTYPL